MASGRHRGDPRSGNVKVPEITAWFWIVKLLTTAMGEAMSDFLVLDVSKYLAVIVGFIVWAIAMAAAFRARTYRTPVYWFAVSMVAVFGTMCADVAHVAIGVPYQDSAALFAAGLAVTFITWYRSERTLSIHTINNPRRELFYWVTVTFTFAMGTALGDLTATPLHLGYGASALMFAAAICLPLIAWRLGANAVASFWVAYVLTRPIGASFADFFGMPKSVSGLGIGHGPVALVLLAVVAGLVWFLGATGRDRAPKAAARPAVRRDGLRAGPGGYSGQRVG